MKIGQLVGNLVKLGLLAAGVYVILNWQDIGSSKSDVEAFAERACIDAVRSSYDLSDVSPLSLIHI